MASDWLKMRTDIYRDPKVCRMADFITTKWGETVARNVALQSVTRNAVVGALVSVWGVARHRGTKIGTDLALRGALLKVIDDVTDMPGMGEAMAFVGWAEQTPEGVIFPRFFEEFNADPIADRKEKNNARQERYRNAQKARQQRDNSVTKSATVAPLNNAREEKSREEKSRDNASATGSVTKSKNWQLTGQWDDPKLSGAFDAWAEHMQGKDRRFGIVNADATCMEAGRSGWDSKKLSAAIWKAIAANALNPIDPDKPDAPPNGRSQKPKTRIVDDPFHPSEKD